MYPVFLHCSREEAARRVGNPDRVERGKVTSAEGLSNFLDGRNFTSVRRDNCVEFDTETTAPDAVARGIVSRFGLGR